MDNNHRITILVEKLCDEFALNFREIDYIQKTEMLYIYRVLVKQNGTDNYGEIASTILDMRYKLHLGGRSLSLYKLYSHLKAQEMKGKYDTSAKRPPDPRLYS